ncbi:hypothetical protein BC826DRAFT_222369 [Russula brevipes]|nr:hypothetical protein BC826DRAFT_222369 [Russula brevipes]
MFYHVGEWSRDIARDYRHHPLVSIFTSALMIPLSLNALHCIVTWCRDIKLAGLFLTPASSHRAPFMVSFSFHAATEHSEFDSLVMYARRKIVTVSDMLSTGSLDGGSHFSFKLVPAGVACLTEYSDTVVCVYVLIFRGTTRIIFIDKYFALFGPCEITIRCRLCKPCKKSRVYVVK